MPSPPAALPVAGEGSERLSVEVLGAGKRYCQMYSRAAFLYLRSRA